ncbi:MAG: penicillin-binding transpeptidase domain-containing protein [Angelakisella sp.]
MSKLPNNQIRRRLAAAGAILTVLGFGMVVRQLYIIQIENGDFYQKKALSQQLRTTSITANRGAIYDRSGNILAVSQTVWTVLFSPADITDAQAELLADGMSEILGVDRSFIIEKAKNKQNYYQVVKRRVDKATADKVIKFAADNKIIGVTLEEDSKRSYPYGSLASSVLGFVNTENKGAYGLEAYYNTTLSGTPGRKVSAKNAWGTDMPFRYENMYSPQDGNSVVLTIDATVQQIMERHLRTAVIEHGVRNRAAGIFMDIKTGAVLGMVSMPDFDPNEPNMISYTPKREAVELLKPLPLGENATEAEKEQYKAADAAYNAALLQAQFEQWNNKCISEPYEPGSVFKTVTLAAGLETGAVNLNSSFYCPGYHMVGKVRKSCWKAGGHGSQDLAAAARNSCNPAFMMIGSAIGAHDFYQYFANFGLTEPTGISLPGEEAGVYNSQKTLADPNDY